MLKLEIHFSNKTYGSNFIKQHSLGKLLWFEIAKMLIAVLQKKLIALFIVIFGTLSSPVLLSIKEFANFNSDHMLRTPVRGELLNRNTVHCCY